MSGRSVWDLQRLALSGVDPEVTFGGGGGESMECHTGQKRLKFFFLVENIFFWSRKCFSC